MGTRRRVTSAPKEDESMSIAAEEAFRFLNAGTRQEYRGWGDTQTAARDRAARKAGVTPAQAERVWKRWREMKTVNGDVYRALRNTYETICNRIETAADAIEAEAHEIEEANASMASRQAPYRGAATTTNSKTTD